MFACARVRLRVYVGGKLVFIDDTIILQYLFFVVVVVFVVVR